MVLTKYAAAVVLAFAGSLAMAADAVQISPEKPESVAAALKQAVASGAKKLVIPPGVYEIPSAEKGAYRVFHLRVDRAKDLEIDATGVTLVFTDRQQQSLSFYDCENVTLRGVTLMRKVPSISQGVIEAIREDGRSIDVRIDKGYPTDIDDRKIFTTFWTNVMTMDRTQWLAHYRAATPPVMERIEPDLYRVAMVESRKTIGINLEVGQPLVWRGEVFDDLRLNNCKGMKIIDVTVATGSGMCFHEMGGEGGHLYRGCKVIPGNAPAGATHKPMMSSSADGLHSSDVRRGPTIENCYFESIDDDAIAIHGFYACAIESKENKLIIWRVNNSMNKRYALPGDRLRLIDEKGVNRATAKVVDSRELTDYQVPADYQRNKDYRLFSDISKAKCVELTLDVPVKVEPNWLVSNVDECGAGYVIRNTVIRGGGARGIMVKADDGLIEGCTIERTARAAIELMPEHIIWPESDYSRNVVIRNNVIRNVSFNRQEGFLRHAGSIAIYGYRSDVKYLPAGGHRNIVIEGNRFEDNNGPNIMIATADTVAVRNNTFVRPMQIPSEFGVNKGVNPKALVFVTQSTNISIENNSVTSPGPGMSKMLEVTPTASGMGFETGMTLVNP